MQNPYVIQQEGDKIDQIQASYDELSYESKPFSQTSIEYLSIVGAFRGIPTVNPDQARVLEIGASFGGNIIGQAAFHPNATFVGIDLSETQVKKGNEVIESIGLTNIRLEAKNIMDIDPDFGTFDYIIVHGIYSWVPDMVKDKILSICRHNLSENGLAYVSYNTYPGWKRMDIIRDMMLYTNIYHRDLPLEEQTRRSKLVASIMQEMIDTSKQPSLYQTHLREGLAKVVQDVDYYIAHEYLENVNDPIYFHEMADRSRQHDLLYIGDADLYFSCKMTLPENIKARVEQLAQGDRFVVEQCIDYYLGTTFRRSIFAHPAQAGNLNLSERATLNWLDGLVFMGNHPFEAVKGKSLGVLQLVMNEFIQRGELFTTQDMMKAIEAKINEWEQHNREEEAHILKQLTKVDMYSFLVQAYILSHIRAYRKELIKVDFEDQKVIVPPLLAKYVAVITLGGHPIGLGDRCNRLIEDIHEGHILVMQALATPKTRAELVAFLEDRVTVNRTNSQGETYEMSAKELVQEILAVLSLFGFLRSKEG